jgi:hypothetical protein
MFYQPQQLAFTTDTTSKQLLTFYGFKMVQCLFQVLSDMRDGCAKGKETQIPTFSLNEMSHK